MLGGVVGEVGRGGATRRIAVVRLVSATLLVLSLTACSLWPFGGRTNRETATPTPLAAPTRPVASQPTLGALPPARTDSPAATPTPVTAAGARPLRIDVYDNRLEPARVLLKSGDSVTVQLANHGRRDCRFVVQHYPQQIDVPSGQSIGFSFTVPSIPAFLGSVQASAGCQGDPTRTGSITVQP